jgi:hypothetical protein
MNRNRGGKLAFSWFPVKPCAGYAVLPAVPVGARKTRDGKRFLSGQVGAMVADFKGNDVYLQLKEKTRKEYSIYLNLFVEKFGERYWRRISAGEARTWLVGHSLAGGPAGMHSLYRTVRAMFGNIRLVYEDVDHPGIVKEEENPFLSLDLSLPKAAVILSPAGAVEAFVQLANELGQPSMGDAVVMMSWLGIRKQDWLDWPATVFDGDLLAFAQEKTDKPLVIPWKLAPPLVLRVAAARERRTADAVTASTFFHDRHGRPWGKPGRFRDAFNKLRDALEKKHPHFATRYYVSVDPEDALRLPTKMLTMRTMRHTCIRG